MSKRGRENGSISSKNWIVYSSTGIALNTTNATNSVIPVNANKIPFIIPNVKVLSYQREQTPTAQMILDFLSIAQNIDEDMKSKVITAQDAIEKAYASSISTTSKNIRKRLYDSMILFVKSYGVYERLKEKEPNIQKKLEDLQVILNRHQPLPEELQALTQDGASLVDSHMERYNAFVQDYKDKVKLLGLSVLEMLQNPSDSVNLTASPQVNSSVLPNVYSKNLYALVDSVESIKKINTICTSNSSINPNAIKQARILLSERDVYTNLYTSILSVYLRDISLRYLLMNVSKPGNTDAIQSFCAYYNSMAQTIDELRKFFVDIMTSTGVVSLSKLFEDDLAKMKRLNVALWTPNAKELYDIIHKMQMQMQNYVVGSQIQGIASFYVVAGVLFKNGFSNENTKRDNAFTELARNGNITQSEIDSARKFVTNPDTRMKLIEDYENVSGAVRVYIKLRDDKIVKPSYLVGDTVVQKAMDKHVWHFLSEEIKIIDDKSISIKPQCVVNTECSWQDFGPFYKVIPPYAAIQGTTQYPPVVQRVNINIMAEYFFGLQNLCNILVNSTKQVNLTLFTYGYSGSGKTFTLFGNSGTRGLVQHILERINQSSEGAAVTFESYTTLYGYFDINKVGDKLDNKAKVVDSYTITPIILPSNASVDVISNKIQDVISTLSNGASRYALDSFIKSTTNNPDSSRGFLLLKFVVKRTDGTQNTLLIVDMAGNEDPHDILIKTLPNYHIPYKVPMTTPKNPLTKAPSFKISPIQPSPPQKKTLFTSLSACEIDMYANITKTVLNVSLTRVLAMIYEPVKYLSGEISTFDIRKQRILGHSASDKNRSDVNLDNGTVLAILNKLSDSNKFTHFYSESKIAIMKPYLSNIEDFLLEVYTLNYNLYELTFKTFIQVFEKLSKKKEVPVEREFVTAYANSLNSFFPGKPFQTSKSPIPKPTGQIDLTLNIFLNDVINHILTNIQGKHHISDSRLFTITTKDEHSIFLVKDDYMINLILLLEMHKRYLLNIKSYTDLQINDINNEPYFTRSQFDTLRDDLEIETNNLIEIHKSILLTIDEIYFNFLKKQKNEEEKEGTTKKIDYELVILRLCVIKYTVEFALFYDDIKNSRNSTDTETLLVFKHNGNNPSQYAFKSKPSQYTFTSKDANLINDGSTTKDLIDKIDNYDKLMSGELSQDTSSTKSKTLSELKQYLEKSAVYKYMNNQAIDTYFSKRKTTILFARTTKNDEGEEVETTEKFEALPAYFQRIVFEGFYINQVNHELMKLLFARKEDPKALHTIPIRDQQLEPTMFSVMNMYGENYNANHHIIRDEEDKQPSIIEEGFALTKLYNVMNDLLNLKNPDIDQKFYMICNIRPENSYRHGAITSLELMQELVKI